MENPNEDNHLLTKSLLGKESSSSPTSTENSNKESLNDKFKRISNEFDVCFIFPVNKDTSSKNPFEKEGEEIVRTLIQAVSEDDILIYRSAHRNKSNSDKAEVTEKDENKMIVLIRLSNERAICISHIKGHKLLASHDKLAARAKEGWKANDEKNQKKVHPLIIDLHPRTDITQYQPFEHIYLKYSHDDAFQSLYRDYEHNKGKIVFSRTARLKILKDLIDDNYEEVDDGISIDLERVVLPQANGDPPIVLAIFPLHDDDVLQKVKRSCQFIDFEDPENTHFNSSSGGNSNNKISSMLKLNFKHFFPWWLDYLAIKDYFGEKIALYYVFTGWYYS